MLPASGQPLRCSGCITSPIVTSLGFCEIGPMPACVSAQGGSRKRGGARTLQMTGEFRDTLDEKAEARTATGERLFLGATPPDPLYDQAIEAHLGSTNGGER
jgi:hypothetical protein